MNSHFNLPLLIGRSGIFVDLILYVIKYSNLFLCIREYKYRDFRKINPKVDWQTQFEASAHY